MHLIKPCSAIPEIAKSREGNADVTNKVYLGSDLANKLGNVSPVCNRLCGGKKKNSMNRKQLLK
jgi:hypothetical protein